MDDLENGFVAAQRIAKLSVFTLVAIGVAELAMGRVTNSIGLQSDGVDSLSDAAISMMVWLGLRYSRRSPDREFNFGYLKVENFAAFVASLGMLTAATVIAYYSYLRLLSPTPLAYGSVAIATLLVAGAISLYRAIQMRQIANRYNLLSLKTDANNSIKDASASFVVAVAVLVAIQGFHYMDAVGGLIISAYIYSVAYVSIREASLVLLDAFNRPEVAERIRNIVEGKYHLKVARIRLRRAGPYIMGTVVILADERLTLSQVHEMKRKMRADLRAQIKGVGILSLVFYPATAASDEGF